MRVIISLLGAAMVLTGGVWFGLLLTTSYEVRAAPLGLALIGSYLLKNSE